MSEEHWPTPPRPALVSDEYPPEGRFAWDLVMDEMTSRELNEMCDYADVGDLNGAESVIAQVEQRLFRAA